MYFLEIWQIFASNFRFFMLGVANTLIISLTATIFGFFISLLISIVRETKVGKILCPIYINVFRGTPMLVQAMILGYGLPMAFGFSWSRIAGGQVLCGIIVVTINTGAYLSETIRSGIQSLDIGQSEAAKSLGFSKWQTMRLIILPQAIRNVIPAIGNEFIVNIKDTSVLTIINVTELFYYSRGVASENYKIIQTYLVTASIYLSLTTIFTFILNKVETKLDRTKSTKKSLPASQTDSKQILDVKQ